MSWSITFVGAPENVAKALEANSAKLNGQSKEEYDAAFPHLVALVKENISQNPVTLKVTANGSGHKNSDGTVNHRSCVASIEAWYGVIV
jgi:hypothetical protein